MAQSISVNCRKSKTRHFVLLNLQVGLVDDKKCQIHLRGNGAIALTRGLRSAPFRLLFWYNNPMLTREDIAFMYLEQLPFEPYPFQEQAILDWFSSGSESDGGGTLVCAPTGMGKTLIVEAGIYETMPCKFWGAARRRTTPRHSLP